MISTSQYGKDHDFFQDTYIFYLFYTFNAKLTYFSLCEGRGTYKEIPYIPHTIFIWPTEGINLNAF